MYKQGNFEFINVSKTRLKEVITSITDLFLIVIKKDKHNTLAIRNYKDILDNLKINKEELISLLTNYNQKDVKFICRLLK